MIFTLSNIFSIRLILMWSGAMKPNVTIFLSSTLITLTCTSSPTITISLSFRVNSNKISSSVLSYPQKVVNLICINICYIFVSIYMRYQFINFPVPFHQKSGTNSVWITLFIHTSLASFLLFLYMSLTSN